VTYIGGKPCLLQGMGLVGSSKSHWRPANPNTTRLSLLATVGLDRWSISTEPGLQTFWLYE